MDPIKLPVLPFLWIYFIPPMLNWIGLHRHWNILEYLVGWNVAFQNFHLDPLGVLIFQMLEVNPFVSITVFWNGLNKQQHCIGILKNGICKSIYRPDP